MSEFIVRQLTENDWLTFRLIRLESLTMNPEYFAPSQDETIFTPEQWRERLSDQSGASFGLFRGADVIGLTGIIRENNNPLSDRALLTASYIRDEFRGKHLSRMFYEARIAWAKNQKNIKTLLIHHREDNLASKKAIQRFDFKYINSAPKTYLDGTQALSLAYELQL